MIDLKHACCIFLLGALLACEREGQPVLDETGVHTCKLRLEGAVTGFDEPGTKAGESFSFTNENKIYVRMVAGGNVVLGEASYNEDNASWSFTYNGSLGGATQGSAHAVLFERNFSTSTLQVSCSFRTPVYEDAEASFAVAADGITLSANLTPKTGRISFVHDLEEGAQRWVWRDLKGISYYSSFDLSDFSFRQTDGIEETWSNRGDSGYYGEFFYGFFTDPSDPQIMMNRYVYYFRHFPTNIFLSGQSGYINHPEENEDGWTRYEGSPGTWLPGVNGSAGKDFIMKYVPAGSFIMGDGSEEAASPVHPVTLSHYYIGEKEVTRDMWYNVMGEPSDWANNIAPVMYQDYDQIQVFIRKLNERTGWRFRLPTEAEWEFAARGGIYSKGYMYSGSNNPDDVALRWADYASGARAANELGLYDMSGDVAELCEDWYGPYSADAQVDPKGPETGQVRVVRGGFRYDDDASCTVWHRGTTDDYGSSSDAVGFRLAMDVPPFGL